MAKLPQAGCLDSLEESERATRGLSDLQDMVKLEHSRDVLPTQLSVRQTPMSPHYLVPTGMPYWRYMLRSRIYGEGEEGRVLPTMVLPTPIYRVTGMWNYWLKR